MAYLPPLDYILPAFYRTGKQVSTAIRQSTPHNPARKYKNQPDEGWLLRYMNYRHGIWGRW
jgi:hypothetical protein